MLCSERDGTVERQSFNEGRQVLGALKDQERRDEKLKRLERQITRLWENRKFEE